MSYICDGMVDSSPSQEEFERFQSKISGDLTTIREELDNSLVSRFDILSQELSTQIQRVVSQISQQSVSVPSAGEVPSTGKAAAISGGNLPSVDKSALIGQAGPSTGVPNLPDPAVTVDVRNYDVPVDNAVTFDSVPYLETAVFGNVIGDGFRERPQSSPEGDKPHLYSLDNELTHQRIVAKYPKIPVHKNEALLEYNILHCYGFYLSCCAEAIGATLFAKEPKTTDDGRSIIIPREHFQVLCSASKTIYEVEGALRDRLASIRYKYDPAKDHHYEEYSNQVLFKRHFGHLGSERFSHAHESYQGELGKHSLIQLAKAAAGVRQQQQRARPRQDADKDKEKEKDKDSKKKDEPKRG